MVTTSGNIILTMGDLGVTIFTTRVEEVVNKTLIVHPLPTAVANFTSRGGSGAVDPLIIDLLRNETRFAVDGWIKKDFGSAANERSEADQKRADLISMVNGGGSQTMTWNGTNYTVNIDKITITQEEGSGENATDEVEIFMVKFTAVLGAPYVV